MDKQKLSQLIVKFAPLVLGVLVAGVFALNANWSDGSLPTSSPSNSSSSSDAISPSQSDSAESTYSGVVSGDDLSVCPDLVDRSNIFGHDGSESDPFLIADQADLYCMRELVNQGSEFVSGTKTQKFSDGLYWKLADDIELDPGNSYENVAASDWEGIGSKDHPFSGHLLGSGHKISGIPYVPGASPRRIQALIQEPGYIEIIDLALDN